MLPVRGAHASDFLPYSVFHLIVMRLFYVVNPTALLAKFLQS